MIRRDLRKLLGKEHPAVLSIEGRGDKPITIDGRTYVDARVTPNGSNYCSPHCEHCDGERSHMVRHDQLRGWCCPPCDSALDEMLNEPD